MGSNASTGGGGGGVGPAGITKKGTYGTVKDAKKVSKRNEFRKFVKSGGVIGAVTKPFREKTEAVNRKFFEEKVVPAGKLAKGTTYKTYMKNRLAGKTDAYGNPISQSDNGGAIASSGQVVQAPPASQLTVMPKETPTAVEISQSEATKAEDPIELRKRRAKARGRSPTIMSGVTGATGSLTLGKPSLLGS